MIKFYVVNVFPKNLKFKQNRFDLISIKFINAVQLNEEEIKNTLNNMKCNINLESKLKN